MSREADSASRALKKSGEPVVITFKGSPSYDPITGAPIAGGSDVSYTVNGYPGQYGKDEVDGSTILSSDVRLILELLPVRPAVGCTALVDGALYRVMTVRYVRKAGEDVIYICGIRKN